MSLIARENSYIRPKLSPLTQKDVKKQAKALARLEEAPEGTPTARLGLYRYWYYDLKWHRTPPS